MKSILIIAHIVALVFTMSFLSMQNCMKSYNGEIDTLDYAILLGCGLVGASIMYVLARFICSLIYAGRQFDKD